MEIGCSSYSKLKIGNTKVSGSEEDLSTLTFEADIWNELTLAVEDQIFIVKINDEEVYRRKYEGRLGDLLGIELET